MKCPRCKDRTEVLHTEGNGKETKRRRRCLNPSCRFRFVTREQANAFDVAEVTTESVMTALNLSRGRSRFDVEAVAAAIAVDKRRVAIRRDQKARERTEWEDGFDPAPTRLDRNSLRKEMKGY